MYIYIYMCINGVPKNEGTPKSSFSVGCPMINHPFWGTTMYENLHVCVCVCAYKPATPRPPDTLYACMDGCMDVWMDGCKDVWMYGCMDAWMHGCMDAWMHLCMYVRTYVCIYIYRHNVFIYIYIYK